MKLFIACILIFHFNLHYGWYIAGAAVFVAECLFWDDRACRVATGHAQQLEAAIRECIKKLSKDPLDK